MLPPSFLTQPARNSLLGHMLLFILKLAAVPVGTIIAGLAVWIIHDLVRHPETHDTETPGRTE